MPSFGSQEAEHGWRRRHSDINISNEPLLGLQIDSGPSSARPVMSKATPSHVVDPYGSQEDSPMVSNRVEETPRTGISGSLSEHSGDDGDAAAAVESQLRYLRSMSNAELLDLMEDRITDLMDVSREYHTPFAQAAVPAEGTPPPPTAGAADYERVLRLLCGEVVNAADNHTVFDPDINQPDDSMAVLLTIIKADYLNQQAELDLQHMSSSTGIGSTDARVARRMKQPAVDRAFQAYRSATEHAFDTLPATHSLRLHTALKFAIFCSDTLKQPRLAFETAEQAYNATCDALPRMKEEEVEDVAPLLQRLRDRISQWSVEVDELDSDVDMSDISDGEAQPSSGSSLAQHGSGPAPPLPQASKSSLVLSGDGADSEALSADGLSLGHAPVSARRHRPFSAVSTVLSAPGSGSTPRDWLDTLRQRKEKAKKRKARAGRLGMLRAAARFAAAAKGGQAAVDELGFDSDDDDEEGEESSTVATGGIGLTQIESVMSQMPRTPPVDAVDLPNALSTVPPLHELFSRYSPQVAAAGTRQAGGTVVFEKSSMDMDAFVHKALGAHPNLPFEDFQRMLRDFKVVPKLVSEEDTIVMMRMTTRGFPQVLRRNRPKTNGYRNNRRRESLFSSSLFDPIRLITDDNDASISLTYLQFLDLFGRVAVVAFAQPPFRSRYETIRDRIQGFFEDFMKLCEPSGEWRSKISVHPSLLPSKDPKLLGYRNDQKGPTGIEFSLSSASAGVLQEQGNQHAFTLLFDYYRRVHAPRGNNVLFSDIASTSSALTISELMKFAVDFGFVPKMVSRRALEAMYRAQQKQGKHLERGSSLDKASRRRRTASAQAAPLNLDSFVAIIGRLAVEANLPVEEGAGAEATSHVYKVRKLLQLLGLPENCSRHDADRWWAQTRNNLIEGGRGSPQRAQPLMGRPVNWGASRMYVTTTGLHKMPSLKEMESETPKMNRAKSAPSLVEGQSSGAAEAPSRSPKALHKSQSESLLQRKVWRPQRGRNNRRASKKPPFARVDEEDEDGEGDMDDDVTVLSGAGTSVSSGTAGNRGDVISGHRHVVGTLPIQSTILQPQEQQQRSQPLVLSSRKLPPFEPMLSVRESVGSGSMGTPRDATTTSRSGTSDFSDTQSSSLPSDTDTRL